MSECEWRTWRSLYDVCISLPAWVEQIELNSSALLTTNSSVALPIREILPLLLDTLGPPLRHSFTLTRHLLQAFWLNPAAALCPSRWGEKHFLMTFRVNKLRGFQHMLLPDAQLWLTGYCLSACQHNAYSSTRKRKTNRKKIKKIGIQEDKKRTHFNVIVAFPEALKFWKMSAFTYYGGQPDDLTKTCAQRLFCQACSGQTGTFGPTYLVCCWKHSSKMYWFDLDMARTGLFVLYPLPVFVLTLFLFANKSWIHLHRYSHVNID